ncbi:MAG TPA: NAD regulator [Hyphomicrobiaceae bacterium]|nr:NAD regulator [Hyphomicrobiaceae bacterium]
MTADDRAFDLGRADFVSTAPPAAGQIDLRLIAAVAAVRDDEPMILTVRGADGDQLPAGGFTPSMDRTLEAGVRSTVSRDAGLDLGHVEQLVTLSDHRASPYAPPASSHRISVAYLALARMGESSEGHGASRSWKSWYTYLPWEDWRQGRPTILDEQIIPRLAAWAQEPDFGRSNATALGRGERVKIAFATGESAWDEERVLERYELLFESGLLEEARAEGRRAPLGPKMSALGRPMQFDHRRILATAISRVRGKIKSRPIVFEMMAAEFTLFELQRTVEALLGPHLHKQNFRRLIEAGRLVEPTGSVRSRTGGRPAKLFRFRSEVVVERAAPGVRVRPPR